MKKPARGRQSPAGALKGIVMSLPASNAGVNSNGRRARPGTNGKARKVVLVSAWSLFASYENTKLYRERTEADADYARLVQSVRERGVETPLLVTRDRYIISGHQRQKAAQETERFMVPVLFLDVSRKQYSDDEWLALLREHNCGREKTFDELMREKLIDIDPDEAIAQIEDERAERTRTRVETIAIGEKAMTRHAISTNKRGMADAILKILKDLAAYLPVSERAIHYRLLELDFFRHAKKKTRYLNDRASSNDLSDMATRMRIAEEIPWDAISDETRPVTTWNCWRNAADFVGAQCDDLLRGYARDLLQSQQQHFEIVVEKLTVKNFVEQVAARYCMPVVVMRGNSSIQTRREIVNRFQKSGKRRLFLLCLGDCDPDGDNIVDSTLRSLRDDFEISGVQATRVAMTHKQADELGLPKKLEAKEQSSNYGAFVAKHGRTDCYELDAVDPEVLQDWLDTAIRGVIDVEAYNHEVDQQKSEAASILAKRQAVLDLMNPD
jgi:hypothetical protein